MRGQAGGRKAGLRVVIVLSSGKRLQEKTYTDQRLVCVPPFKLELGMV